MEEFKTLEEITNIDEKHALMGAVCGFTPSLEGMHRHLSDERLNESVPVEIKGQFNVARSMALYTYFFYALAPEVHLKVFTVIEHALRLKVDPEGKKKMMLRKLMEYAVKNGLVKDSGFRHLENISGDNSWCISMIDGIPKLRNAKAHGSSYLYGDCLLDISICADYLNQLFPEE